MCASKEMWNVAFEEFNLGFKWLISSLIILWLQAKSVFYLSTAVTIADGGPRSVLQVSDQFGYFSGGLWFHWMVCCVKLHTPLLWFVTFACFNFFFCLTTFFLLYTCLWRAFHAGLLKDYKLNRRVWTLFWRFAYNGGLHGFCFLFVALYFLTPLSISCNCLWALREHCE